MKRANAYEGDRRTRDRFASTLIIATAIIAAVRLARDKNISRPSPRLATVISDCVGLARMILGRVSVSSLWCNGPKIGMAVSVA